MTRSAPGTYEMTRIKRILITGIAGYIGGTIAVKLKERGYDILGLARKDSDIEALKALGIQALKGSLQDVDVTPSFDPPYRASEVSSLSRAWYTARA
jgi:nucleoside-diphosphate-sugar epimerase